MESVNAKSDQNLRNHQTLGFYLKEGHVWPQKEEMPFHSTFVKILSVLMFISKKKKSFRKEEPSLPQKVSLFKSTDMKISQDLGKDVFPPLLLRSSCPQCWLP